MRRGAKVSFIKVIAICVACLVIIQGIGHIILFGTGMSGLLTNGLQGRFSQISGVIEFRGKYNGLAPYSFRLLIIEILIFIACIGYSAYIKMHKNNSNANDDSLSQTEVPEEIKTKEALKLPENINDKSKIRTDIDVLYILLKERKRISFPSIEKTFKVDREIVMSWAHILESSNLALIYQPKFGDPELWLDEKQ